MRQILLILCLWISSTLCFSKDLSGTYINEYGERIVIDGDMLFLMAREQTTHSPIWWEKDTLATCLIKRINKSLLEVNSVDVKLLRTWSIESVYEERIDDSIKINFVIPYTRDDLEITVGAFPQYRDYKNKNHEKTVNIPRCKEIDFEIRPTKEIVEHRPGISDGRLYFGSFDLPIHDGNIPVKDGVNRIDIKLPSMDDLFFSRYYVRDEYIYVKENILHWKGKEFRKRK